MRQRLPDSNVLFIIIDGLRYDRIGRSDYTPSPTPNLDRYFSRAVWAHNALTTGCPTQFAFPGIFTSTLPLDHGGYDLGIRLRDKSFVELIQNAGYRTGGFVAGAWANRFHGYDRGFETYHQLFDISLFLQNFRIFDLDYPARQYQCGETTLDACVEDLVLKLPLVFDFLMSFSRDKREEIGRGRVPYSPIIHNWNYDELDKLFADEERRFRQDPRGYAVSLIEPASDNLVFRQLPGARPDPRKATTPFVLESMRRWIHQQDKRPFFAWAHLMDVHDANFSTYDILASKADLQRDALRIADCQRLIMQAGNGYIGNTVYDYSIAYVDQYLTRLFDDMRTRGLLENTLVVLCSDHGSRGAGMPRPDLSEVTAFYEELIHVPIALWHSRLPPRTIEGLCSVLDIGPTILALLGIDSHDSFRGVDMLGDGPELRQHVPIEHLGRGPCDFSRKAINICLRSRNYKLIYQSPPGNLDGAGSVTECYDLDRDPQEYTNLAVDGKTPPAVEDLRSLAQKRCREIRGEQDGLSLRRVAND